MDISSINRTSNVQKAELPRQDLPKAQEAKIERPNLTVTHAPVSQEDALGIDVPETALTRKDALGELVSSAFQLPAPPMPEFK
jgi:hypothetical protein